MGDEHAPLFIQCSAALVKGHIHQPSSWINQQGTMCEKNAPVKLLGLETKHIHIFDITPVYHPQVSEVQSHRSIQARLALTFQRGQSCFLNHGRRSA